MLQGITTDLVPPQRGTVEFGQALRIDAGVLDRLQHFGCQGIVEIVAKMLAGTDGRLFGEQALAKRFQRIAERREHAHPCDYYPLALNHV